MSVQSRFREPRPRWQQGRMSELSRTSLDYYGLISVRNEPAGLLYTDEAPLAIELI